MSITAVIEFPDTYNPGVVDSTITAVVASGVEGATGAAGPNSVSDTTSLGSLTDASADALFLLAANAGGTLARKITLSSVSRSLLGGTAAQGRTALGLGTAALSATGDFAAAVHTHAAADIVSGILATARLGTGTANNTTYLRGDGTWAAVSGGGSDHATLSNLGYAASGHTGFAGLGVANTWTVGGQLIQTGAAGTVGLRLQGAASQTASLIELWGVSSTPQNRVQAAVNSSWATSTDATRAGQLSLGAYYTTTLQTGLTISANADGIVRSLFGGVVGVGGGYSLFYRVYVSTGGAGSFGGMYIDGTNSDPYIVCNNSSSGQTTVMYAGLLSLNTPTPATTAVLSFTSGSNLLYGWFDSFGTFSWAGGAPSRDTWLGRNSAAPGVIVQTTSAAAVNLTVKGTGSQTANLTEWQNSSGTALSAIDKNGGLVPASMADGTAANGTVYYSTTANKMVFKDSGGTVNNLY